MTTPHRATPEQWSDLGVFATDTRACVLELRARIEALESKHATCPHIVTSDEGTSYCRLAEQNASTAAASAYAGSLVKRVAARVKYGIDANQEPESIARAAIREVASDVLLWAFHGIGSTPVGVATWLIEQAEK